MLSSFYFRRDQSYFRQTLSYFPGLVRSKTKDEFVGAGPTLAGKRGTSHEG